MSKKTNGQELQEKLTWKFPHIAKDAPQQMEKASKFCEGYKEVFKWRQDGAGVRAPGGPHVEKGGLQAF